jgi:methionyl-tRNA formyltransferase
MGTAEFAVPSLSILFEHRHEICAVVTAPDKPQGRGLMMRSSPIKEFAMKHQLPLLQPMQIKDEKFYSHIRELAPELIVVVAFRILPKEVFMFPRFGSINLHASLLPKYRGAAPINWAIINGERETGVTTFFLQEKVDTGNIILRARVSISEVQTAGELHDILADTGAELVLHSVQLIESNRVREQQQEKGIASFAPKIFRSDCKINWQKSAKEIHNFIRGLSPSPCAFTTFRGGTIKIYESKILFNKEKPIAESGTIVDTHNKLAVAVNNGVIELITLQREGKKRLSAADFLRGTSMQCGEKFV